MKLYSQNENGEFEEVEITIENVIDVDPYTLPTMNVTLKGGAKVDNGLYMTDETLNATPYNLPTASSTIKGGVKIGEGLTMTGEFLNAQTYFLPTASKNIKGGVKVGDGLFMSGESLNAYALPTASNAIKGGVKVGSGLYMTGETLNAYPLGGVTLGDGFSLDDGTLKFDPLENLTLGPGFDTTEGIINFKPIDVLPIGDGLTVDGGTLKATNADPNPFYNFTLGDGFTLDNGELKFDPLAVMPLGERLKLSSDGALALALGSALGDTVLIENPYELPTMSEFIKGGAKVGVGLYMTGETLNINITTIAQEAASFVSVSSSESSEEYHGLTLSVLDVETEEERDALVENNRELCYRRKEGASNIYYWTFTGESFIFPELGGELLLPEDFMDIDFKILNIDNKEISVTGELYDKYVDGYNSRANISTLKQRRIGNGDDGFIYRTSVWLARTIMDKLVEDKIKIEWGFHSEKGNVNFKGTYIDLPRNPVHGWLVCKGGYFYLYDATVKMWREFNAGTQVPPTGSD